MKTERIRTGATVTNDILVTDPDYVSYVIDSIHREASRELMQRIGDGNEYIVRINDREEDITKLCEKELTTTVHVAELVRCKDCKYSYTMMTARSKDGQERWTRFCDKHKNWFPKDDWFCKDGEGKE